MTRARLHVTKTNQTTEDNAEFFRFCGKLLANGFVTQSITLFLLICKMNTCEVMYLFIGTLSLRSCNIRNGEPKLFIQQLLIEHLRQGAEVTT